MLDVTDFLVTRSGFLRGSIPTQMLFCTGVFLYTVVVELYMGNGTQLLLAIELQRTLQLQPLVAVPRLGLQYRVTPYFEVFTPSLQVLVHVPPQ